MFYRQHKTFCNLKNFLKAENSEDVFAGSCEQNSVSVTCHVTQSETELCWFQTSLPLAALPLCRVIIACCFRVTALSGNAALALSPSGIAPELNRIQLSAICRGGQSGKIIDLLAWRCLPLGHPSAASGACAVEQISSSKRQCGKRQVSLKPALLLELMRGLGDIVLPCWTVFGLVTASMYSSYTAFFFFLSCTRRYSHIPFWKCVNYFSTLSQCMQLPLIFWQHFWGHGGQATPSLVGNIAATCMAAVVVGMPLLAKPPFFCVFVLEHDIHLWIKVAPWGKIILFLAFIILSINGF